MLLCAVSCALTACGEPPEEPLVEPQVEPWFSLVVIADPHITGPGDRVVHLEKAVDWINEQRQERRIELVMVVGDIGWRDGLPIAKTQLDRLAMPYVPIIGDNEVHSESEEAFDTVFAPQYEMLGTALEQWQRASTPVSNPNTGGDSWFQNFSFVHRGVRFIGLDLSARVPDGPIAGELGDLHDFEGGTWRWFTEQLPGLQTADRDSLVMISHIPMHHGLFDEQEMAALVELLEPYRSQLYVNLAGHMHLGYDVTVGGGLYEVFVTDQLCFDDTRLRVVRADHNGTAYNWTHWWGSDTGT